jgi:PIN domain nuclease of toxin-antitoxin system
MVTYVLDSSAVLRYLHNEAGANRVAEIVKEHLAGDCVAVIAAPHWGEVAGITRKLYGKREMERVLSLLGSFGLQIYAADADRSVRAALIKLEKDIPYVDSFAVELASHSHGRDRVLVTADFDFKTAARAIKIDFLPKK